MAVMLQTGRLTDKERLAKFLKEAEYDKEYLIEILNRFGLLDSFNKWKEKLGE